MSGNVSVFTSCEFQDFCSKKGIKHVKSAPYHLASNRLAERAVQTFKEALKWAGTQESLNDNLGIQIFIQLPTYTSFNYRDLTC